MGRITVVEHKGATILLQDFSELRPGEEYQRSLAEARAYIASRPKRSVLSLFDAKGATYNATVMADLKDFARHNEPFIRASAVVGIEGILRIALVGVSRFSGRTFETFPDRASALDWLAEQAAASSQKGPA